jgi:hypothetical protein
MKRVLAALVAAFLVTVLLAGTVQAAEPVVREYRLVDAEDLTVGDPFRIVIKVEADAGTTVFLAPGTIPNDLTLISTPEQRTRSLANGRVEVTYEVVLAPFFVGDYPLPPLALRYRDQSGATGEIRTPAATVRVRSVLPSGGEIVPRDLKSQAEVGSPPAPPYLLIALAVLIAALFATLAVLYWRISRPAPVIPPPPPPEFVPVGPEDRARLALDSAASAFAQEGDLVAFYATLAGTVRGYLSDRFGFPAYALTTSELQARMIASGIDRWQARIAGGLLQQCDAVVYESYRPATSRTDADLTAAYEIVEMSRPADREREVEVAEVSLP